MIGTIIGKLLGRLYSFFLLGKVIKIENNISKASMIMGVSKL